MPKRSSKDLNESAFALVQQVTGKALGTVKATSHEVTVDLAKNPAAVALGRLGGLKGGVARAKKLTPKQRKEIAEKAAASRWSKV